MEETKSIQLSFAALNPYLESNIVKPTERDTRNRQKVEWGTGDKYPLYIYDLFENSPTLRSIILGTVDYVAGNNVSCNMPDFAYKFNDEGDTIEDVYRQFVQDYLLYGCAALNVIRNLGGQISQIYNINMKFLRSDKKNNLFYYSEDFDGNKYTNRVKTLVYPAFREDGDDASSIFFIKNDKYRTYGLPIWAAAVESAETEKRIQEFHLNEICNGFNGSYIVNLCNGVPTDDQKEEIEDSFNDKFGGSENAGRLVIAYSQDKDHAADIQPIPQTDFQDKYNALEKSVRQSIFTALRANPNLFSINTENNGFAAEDFESTYALFNRTMVMPIQKVVKRAFEKLFNTKEAITIEPFSLKLDENKNNTQADIQ